MHGGSARKTKSRRMQILQWVPGMSAARLVGTACGVDVSLHRKAAAAASNAESKNYRKKTSGHQPIKYKIGTN